MPTSETSKYRHITTPYCAGIGVDIGSSGDPVVPHAIQIDLEHPYCPLLGPGPIHIRGDGTVLSKWFAPASLDFVYSSHLIEDFTPDGWSGTLEEWDYCLKHGGYLIILAPERSRWKDAVAAGQPPNDAHQHEPYEGELTEFVNEHHKGKYTILWDSCPDPNDYGLVFIARKL